MSAEITVAAQAIIPIVTKYGPTVAGIVINAVGRWNIGRRIDRIEGILDYFHAEFEGYKLPTGFDQQEQFEDFSAAVLEIGLHTASTRKQRILGQFLLNEPGHGNKVTVTAKSKIVELLAYIQPHHLELLKRFNTSASASETGLPKIQEWQDALLSIEGPPDDRLDLFYSTVSDLLRWFLVRSSETPTGVNVASVAHFIPGTSNASHLRITRIGEQMLGYVKDPQGQFDGFDAIIAEETA